jgi:CBS domain-containing protein
MGPQVPGPGWHRLSLAGIVVLSWDLCLSTSSSARTTIGISESARTVAALREALAMRLGEFMQSPAYTCWPDTSLASAARSMEDHNVGSLLVTDHEGRIAGIVTDRDLALALAHGKDGTTLVEGVMSVNVVTIPEDATLDDAAGAMDSRGVRRLPVADSAGHPVGIICLDDLYRYLTQETIVLAGAVRAQGLPHA